MGLVDPCIRQNSDGCFGSMWKRLFVSRTRNGVGWLCGVRSSRAATWHLCGQVGLCARCTCVLISCTGGVRMLGRMSQKRWSQLVLMAYRSRLEGLKGIGWMGLLWPVMRKIGSAFYVELVQIGCRCQARWNGSVSRCRLHEGRVRMAVTLWRVEV